jgi:4-carboxymuconolactone decarboxylase
MARVDLLSEDGDLTPEARAVAGRIAASRGEVSRPFAILLHSPALAERVAELGHLVRTGSALAEADRELVTLATGVATGCAFIWDSHLDAAKVARVPQATIDALSDDRDALTGRARSLASFVDELCRTGVVSAVTFEVARELLGERGVIDLALMVGYYTMLARVMGAVDAC